MHQEIVVGGCILVWLVYVFFFKKHTPFVGTWESRVFCSKCNRQGGTAYFGSSFHNNEHNPVCPDCGAYKSLTAKTCRINNGEWEIKK